MSCTLTPEDLHSLTGYRQAKRQAEWLAARGWIFEPPARRGERPKVDREYYLGRMSGQAPAATRRRSALNLDAM